MSNTTEYLVGLTSPFITYEVLLKPWQLYTEHLWNYQSDSWVGRVAYSSRLLAFVVLFPFVVLTGLDVASYLIARTLGVIDDVKASTTDKATRKELSPPVIQVHDASPRLLSHPDPYPNARSAQSATNDQFDRVPQPGLIMSHSSDASLSDADELPSLDVSHPHAYFASEENSLKLSGVGVFSPATSRPSSPTLTRRQILPDGRTPLLGMTTITVAPGGGKHTPEGDLDEGLTFRARAHRASNDD